VKQETLKGGQVSAMNLSLKTLKALSESVPLPIQNKYRQTFYILICKN